MTLGGLTIEQIVANDLCIGCGLCESVTAGRVPMTMTPQGSLRPATTSDFTAAEHETLIASCPGAVAQARPEPRWHDREPDAIWGTHGTMAMAWATDPEVRFRSATGGVLTALGMFLVDTGAVASVLHVGADPDAPMRNTSVLSRSAASVFANTGSRYGPAAALSQLIQTLERGEPFAIIAKPCDLGAVHRLAQHDTRVNELCVARLAMVCGGSSRLTKSQALLDEFGVIENEITTFRYRGYGNPGPTVVETIDGRQYSKTYLELWEDEGSWQIETRCKLCPDALGEASDISAADAWPGGAPTGEDEGFNAIVVRSVAGEDLLTAAVEADYLTLAEPVTPQVFDHLQPHQVRKKHALASRYRGMADAGVTPIHTIGLRIADLGLNLDADAAASERAGAKRRMLDL